MKVQGESPIQRLLDHGRPFVLYGSVSVLTACVEFTILHGLLLLHEIQAVAVSAAFLLASAFQFLALRYGVFRAGHRNVALQANAYIIGSVISWWVVLGSVSAITHFFAIGTLAARAIVIPILFPVNYLTNKFIIFKK